MDIENLIGSVVRGALTGKKKKRRGATRYLSGGKGSFLNASTLVALAGVAWGVYETVTQKQAAAQPPQPAMPPTPSGPPLASPPPVPTAPAAPAAAVPEVPAEVLRLVRLVISAARADGSLSEPERQAIREHARAAGAEAIVERELQSSFALSQVVAGVTDQAQREELYTLAFAIVRGDEQVTGGERIYLAQLAHQLGLDAAATERLERAAERRIDQESGNTE
jgi:uncharacterized membrane protein YebE (DUF533 family)